MAIFYYHVAEKLCLFVHLYFWYTDSSAVSVLIENGLENIVFPIITEFFCKPTKPTVHLQEYEKERRCKQLLTHKTSGQWLEAHFTCFLF